MATSTLAIDIENDLTNLESATDSDQDVIDANFTVVAEALNASLETATGHDHDGSNSKSLSAGVSTLSVLDYCHALILGGYQ